MKIQDHYDWIVIGDHPAALLSASLAARLGLSVLILPLVSPWGLFVTDSGQYFDPESNYLMGLGRSETCEGLISCCLSKIGILPRERELIQSVGVEPQVLTPRSRMSLVPHESLLAEFQREFGKGFAKHLGLVQALKASEEAYLSFWRELPYRLTLQVDRAHLSTEAITSRQLQAQLSKRLGSIDPLAVPWASRNKKVSDFTRLMAQSSGDSEASQDLLQVCSGFWYGITSQSHEDPRLFDLLQVLSLSRTGAGFLGGMTVYRQFLIHLARRLGVQVLLKSECRKIFIEKGQFVGVQVAGRGNKVSAGGAVLGTSLQRAYDRAVFSGKNYFSRKKRPLTPKGWKFSIALKVHAEAISGGLSCRSIWKEEGAPSLEIEWVNPEVYAKASAFFQPPTEPPSALAAQAHSRFEASTEDSHRESSLIDTRLIYLRTVLPYTQESLSLEYQQLIAARMTRQLIEIMPFLEYHVTQILPDFREGTLGRSSMGFTFGMTHDHLEKKENEALPPLRQFYSFSSLEEIPDPLIEYEGQGLGFNTGIDRLMLASAESYPELGSLGPNVACLEALAWLAHRSGLAGPFV